MGKATKLLAVMQRYVSVCNDSGPTVNQIHVDDLEFVHVAVLKGTDTAEQGALMKDDVVRVRQNRKEERLRNKEANRMQREADSVFFHEMKRLVNNREFASVALECQGPEIQRGVLEQERPRYLFCDELIVSKRCPWLGRTIAGAREALLLKESEMAPDHPETTEDAQGKIVDAESPASTKRPAEGEIAPPEEDEDKKRSIPEEEMKQNIPEDEDFGEDGIQVLEFEPRSNRNRIDPNADASSVAAQIENDDDSLGEPQSLPVDPRDVVVIANHGPEAMELLLEYCYTNRVVSLGYEAFRMAAHTKPSPREQKGNVIPFGQPKKWPNHGDPNISFEVAAAAISLAEEAQMPRLSLMCEVAACQSVAIPEVIEALTLCKKMQDMWGNPLARLRQAAMEQVFHSRHYDVQPGVLMERLFDESVKERAPLLVPAILSGTADVVEESLGKKNYYDYKERDWKTEMYASFRRHDREDKRQRQLEREKYRQDRDTGTKEQPLIVDELDELNHHPHEAVRKSAKRIRGHSVRSALRRDKRERRGSH